MLFPTLAPFLPTNLLDNVPRFFFCGAALLPENDVFFFELKLCQLSTPLCRLDPVFVHQLLNAEMTEMAFCAIAESNILPGQSFAWPASQPGPHGQFTRVT